MKGAPLRRLYVPDEQAAARCQKSRTENKAISVSGIDAIDGKLASCTGVVHSVEDNGVAAPVGRRWRVTFYEPK
jgi:hypothetical protein